LGVGRPPQGELPYMTLRLAASALLTAALSFGSVASASAQTMPPVQPVQRTIPTPSRGVSLEQAQAAIQAITGRPALATDTSAAIGGNGIVAIFIAPLGVLVAVGNAQDNQITVTRDAAGNLLVNGGSVPILGPKPTVANTTLIELFGLAG